MQREKWPEPAWIGQLPKDHQATARVRFLINLAAIFASEKGTLTALSQALDLGYSAVNMAHKRGRVSPEMAVVIEQKLGRDHFPRELFNEIFVVER